MRKRVSILLIPVLFAALLLSGAGHSCECTFPVEGEPSAAFSTAEAVRGLSRIIEDTVPIVELHGETREAQHEMHAEKVRQNGGSRDSVRKDRSVNRGIPFSSRTGRMLNFVLCEAAASQTGHSFIISHIYYQSRPF